MHSFVIGARAQFSYTSCTGAGSAQGRAAFGLGVQSRWQPSIFRCFQHRWHAVFYTMCTVAVGIGK